MRRLGYLRTLVAALAAWGSAACGEQGPPLAAAATLSWETPHTDDGAVAVTITGPGVIRVDQANSLYRVYWRLVGDGELRAIVLGSLTAGPLLTVELADVERLGAYAVTITEVAARDDAVRATLAGYAARLTRAE